MFFGHSRSIPSFNYSPTYDPYSQPRNSKIHKSSFSIVALYEAGSISKDPILILYHLQKKFNVVTRYLSMVTRDRIYLSIATILRNQFFFLLHVTCMFIYAHIHVYSHLFTFSLLKDMTYTSSDMPCCTISIVSQNVRKNYKFVMCYCTIIIFQFIMVELLEKDV